MLLASIQRGVGLESKLTRVMEETMDSPPPEKTAYELARDRNVTEVQKHVAPVLAM